MFNFCVCGLYYLHIIKSLYMYYYELASAMWKKTKQMKCSTQHLTKVFSPCVKKAVVTEVQFFDDVVTLGDRTENVHVQSDTTAI